MTRAHMHNKAGEMWPTQKPVMEQNKTGYCQLKGRLHSTRTLCTATTQEGGRRGEEPGARPRGLGVTSFSSCPKQKETVSHLCWHRIRMHPAGSPGHPRHGHYSHAAFQRVILHGQGEFISWNCQIVHPDCNEAILYESTKQRLPQRLFQKDVVVLAALNVPLDAVTVIHLQNSCRNAPRPSHHPLLSLPQKLQLSAEIHRTSGCFTAPLNTRCLSGTFFANRSINSLLWAKLHQAGAPAPASGHPFSLAGEHMGHFQVRLDSG